MDVVQRAFARAGFHLVRMAETDFPPAKVPCYWSLVGIGPLTPIEVSVCRNDQAKAPNVRAPYPVRNYRIRNVAIAYWGRSRADMLKLQRAIRLLRSG